MNVNLLSPPHLMEELKARFPETHISIELSWDIFRSGSKGTLWSLYLSSDDVNINQKFSSFPNLLNYANHLIAMHPLPKTQAPVFRFNTN